LYTFHVSKAKRFRVGPYTIEKIKLNINYYNIKPKDIL
jgi:hypothetical protein